MFAVIGQKINDRLRGNTNFVNANGKTLGSELISNNTWNNTTGWFKFPAAAPISVTAVNNTLKTLTGGYNTKANAYTVTNVQQGKSYFCEYSYDSANETSVNIGTTELGSEIHQGVLNSAGTGTTNFTFTATSAGSYYVSFINNSTAPNSFGILTAISVKEITSAKVFPVIIPQGIGYPVTTYEIANVDNFITKSSSLASCDVSLRIACFADDYNTTYNQSKAIVEALDYYSVTYTEGGVSYTAKFRFVSLDDDYYKLPEKFYKNLIFNCLITKN